MGKIVLCLILASTNQDFSFYAVLIGIFSSFVASLVFSFVLWSLKPKIIISDFIARRKEGDDVIYRFNIINLGCRGIINLKLDLVLVEPETIMQKSGKSGPLRSFRKIKLNRDWVFHVPKYSKDDPYAAYEKRFNCREDLDKIWEKEDQYYLLRVFCTDEFSGFSKVFEKEFRNKSNSLKWGEHEFGKSINVSIVD